MELSIFDRRGQQVFHTTNPADCWDGTFKGNLQPTGIYVYFIKGMGSCGIIDQKGTVMLVR
jgi:gliding motility-associated-like protein